MSEFYTIMIREFVGENWELFKAFCEFHKIDPDEFYDIISAEIDD